MTLARVLLCVLLCPWAVAATEWPAGIVQLAPARSDSLVEAVLPSDVSITPPPAELPPARARWSGHWQGWACAGAACDVRIAVEAVAPDGARIVYAGASAQSSFTDRVQARFEGDELLARLGTGARLVLRLRTDGDMEMSLWRPETTLLAYGVLTQKELPPLPYALRTERVPTPWNENGKAVTLEMVLYRPAVGAPPYPTVVFNHGSTGNGDRPELFPLTWTSSAVARYFTEQGWQVLFPQRRGRGKSGGLYDEGFEPDRSRYSCRPELSLPGVERAVVDLDAVMAHVRTRGDVDQRRLLIGGQSRGGILSVVYAGLRPDTFAGVVNFVGGWLGDRCPGVERVNPVLFRRGAAFGKPMLWLYGEGDPFYSLPHSRANFEAFQAAGGKGTFLELVPPAGVNGHAIQMVPGLWRPALDAYLRQIAP